MRPRVYSAFWLAYAAGLICLSSHWATRDTPESDIVSDKEMLAWLRLPERERKAIMRSYAPTRTPPPEYVYTRKNRRQEAA